MLDEWFKFLIKIILAEDATFVAEGSEVSKVNPIDERTQIVINVSANNVSSSLARSNALYMQESPPKTAWVFNIHARSSVRDSVERYRVFDGEISGQDAKGESFTSFVNFPSII